MPTGALMSTTATQQGETIPGICHAIVLESEQFVVENENKKQKQKIQSKKKESTKKK